VHLACDAPPFILLGEDETTEKLGALARFLGGLELGQV